MSKFTHLHVHTEYSILDGLAKIPKLIDKAYKDGQRAMAITDHGNMYAIFEYVSTVEKFNSELPKKEDPFKAIIGCEVYVAANSRFDKKEKINRSGRHLVLLAKNWIGYRNLSRIVSLGFSEGMYYTPRIDKELLRTYSEGIIACSACLGGELPQAILQYNTFDANGEIPSTFQLDAADKVIEEFKSIFGKDYYLELQRNGHHEQKIVNEAIKVLAKKHEVKCIATNDVHFVDKEDFATHKMLICINTGNEYSAPDSSVQDEETDNGLAYSGEEYLRTTEEMVSLFEDYPEAIINTQQLVDKIETIKLKSPPALPVFTIPTEYKNDFEYLEHLVNEGAKKRYPNMSDDVRERINFELETVKKMGFPGYFLIVWDFINAGKKMGIRFGPGRGSAAGSALSYCMGITNIDPIKYELLFERFLNPDRISLPDMDIDIDDAGREKVIKYVIDKYGIDRVAQIVTFNTMAAKSAIKACARVLKLPLSESDRLSKLVPEKPGTTLEEAFKDTPELEKEKNSNNKLIRDTLFFAQQIENTVRGIGVHACGVIIGRQNLFDLVPLCTAKNSDTLVTQYEGKYVEDAGLLKMDFLGLKTLNIISSALDNIKKRHNIEIEIDNIPLDDAQTFSLFSHGETTGIFQFESPGMRKYLQDLKPTRFEDIIAMVSLYRPGPMDKIPTFINRKSGKEQITYKIPIMGKYLDETYGITVYQEQVMLLSQLLAGFTRGQADTLRKAMGKKLIKVMASLEENFFQGGMKNGYKINDLKDIWKEWKKFAEYAFNKSHATCYAYVSYQTAYLKAHYTAEFLAANLTNNLDNLAKIANFIDDAIHKNIKVLGPDINESELTFTVNKNGNIRFGLAALKGVGSSAVESIIQEREANGPFSNIFDFATRINLRNCNKRCFEAMASAGCFDCFPDMHRAQFFNEDKEGKSFIEKLIQFALKQQNNAFNNQFSIFDESPEMSLLNYPEIPQCLPFHAVEQLRREKEVAGFYISGHPLDNYKTIIENFTNIDLQLIQNTQVIAKRTTQYLSFVGIVTAFSTGVTKTNNKDYGRITLEDYSNSWNWALFGEDFSKFKHLFEVGKLLFIKAKVSERYRGKDYSGEPSFDIKPIEVFYLEDAYEKLCHSATLIINIDEVAPHVAYKIKELIEKFPGKVPLTIRIMENNNVFYSDFTNFEYKVNPELFIKNLNLSTKFKVELK